MVGRHRKRDPSFRSLPPNDQHVFLSPQPVLPRTSLPSMALHGRRSSLQQGCSQIDQNSVSLARREDMKRNVELNICPFLPSLFFRLLRPQHLLLGQNDHRSTLLSYPSALVCRASLFSLLPLRYSRPSEWNSLVPSTSTSTFFTLQNTDFCIFPVSAVQ